MQLPPIGDILSHAYNSFNAFKNRDPTYNNGGYRSGYSSYQPNRRRKNIGNERSIVNAIYNRIAVEVAMLDIRHCQLDKDGRFESIVNSSLNECFTTSANLDQTGRAFIQDAALSMLDEGVVALVPIDTDRAIEMTDGFDIETMRVGKVIDWAASEVQVRVYNELTGEDEELWIPKKKVGLPENPFYSTMNAPNSTLQRLIRKLNLLDVIDEQSGSGKLDLIIQLPYSTRSDGRKKQAEERKRAIEEQLVDSKYGIAYADTNEKITQLNRSVDNNLLKQVEYLQNMLYSQLGISQSIMDGTADEATILNFHNGTIGPIVTTLVEEMRRKFLTKTARTQGRTILFFRDPLKNIPASRLAELAETYTRNEIATSNEFRQAMGWKPSKDPRADELRNKNLSPPKENNSSGEVAIDTKKEKEKNQNGEI